MNALFVVVLMSAPLEAPATQPAPQPAAPSAAELERAKELYRAGTRAYQRGRYQVAVEAFEAAREIVTRTGEPKPQVTFSAAQARRLLYFVTSELDDLERAVNLYRAYLEEAPGGPRIEHAAEHLSALTPILERRRLEELSPEAPPKIARLIVTSSADGALASVDDEEARPIPATFEVSPGAHVVKVSAPQHLTATRKTVATLGASVPVNVELMRTPGVLVVKSSDDARVLVDGRAINGMRASLAPGPHDVRVSRARHHAFNAEVEVRSGEEHVLAPELELTAQVSAGYVTLGASAAVLVAAALPTALALVAEIEGQGIEQLAQSRALSPSEAQTHTALKGQRDAARGTALVMVSVAALGALLGAGLVFVEGASE